MNAGGTIYPFFKGRIALHAILRAAGIGNGDQVLMPGYTCVVVPNAVKYAGAEPVYLDIESSTYNLDCKRLEDGAGSEWIPGRAKAIIVQHTYGIPCNMDKIAAFAKRYGLLVVEDSCHALGSTWNGTAVGDFGDAAFFSSQWSKPITTGLGGWAKLNNPVLDRTLQTILTQYTKPKLAEALLLELQYLAFSVMDRPRLFWIIQGIYRTLGKLGIAIGSSSTTELQCKLPTDYQKSMHPLQERRLLNLLRHRQATMKRRVDNARLISDCLREWNLPTLTWPAESHPILLRYPVRVANKQALLLAAKKQQVPLGDWFLSPIHPNEDHWERADYRRGACPVAEAVCRQVVNISTSGNLRPEEISRTVHFLHRYAEFE